MSELKACPFCGSKEVVSGKDYADCSYRVDCLGCTARVYAKSLDFAVSDWNTRPIEDALRAELARLREQTIDYENDIFLGQPIEYWIRIKAQLDADNSDQWVREILLLKSEIERLQAERRWIPVSERLPEVNSHVLVSMLVNDAITNGDLARIVESSGYNGERFVCFLGEFVTHWMPLPPPPESEGE